MEAAGLHTRYHHRCMLQRSLGIACALVVVGAAACAKFSGEEQAPADAGADTGADAGSDNDSTTPTCAGRTVFHAADPSATAWAASTTVKSARLGGDNLWYVTVKDNAGSHIETRSETPPGALVVLPGIADKGSKDEQATLSASLTRLVFQSTRSGAEDAIWVSKRIGRDAPFETPMRILVPELQGTIEDPYFAGDTLYVASGTTDAARAIYRVDVGGTAPPRATPVTRLPGASDHPVVTSDELEMFFVNKASAEAAGAIMLARRAQPTGEFGAPEQVVLPGANEHPTWVSPDGCDLYVVDADDKLQKLSRRP